VCATAGTASWGCGRMLSSNIFGKEGIPPILYPRQNSNREEDVVALLATKNRVLAAPEMPEQTIVFPLLKTFCTTKVIIVSLLQCLTRRNNQD
jgi:hypothetical protein